MKGKWYWRYTHFPRVTMIVGGRVLPGACWSCFQFWNVECKHLFRYFEIEFDWTAKKSKLRGRSCMKLKHHNNVACVCVCVFTYFVLFCVLFCWLTCVFAGWLVWFLGFFCIGYLGCFAARLLPWFRWSRVVSGLLRENGAGWASWGRVWKKGPGFAMDF